MHICLLHSFHFVFLFVKKALIASRVICRIEGAHCMTQVSDIKMHAVQKLFEDLLYQWQMLECFSEG